MATSATTHHLNILLGEDSLGYLAATQLAHIAESLGQDPHADLWQLAICQAVGVPICVVCTSRC